MQLFGFPNQKTLWFFGIVLSFDIFIIYRFFAYVNSFIPNFFSECLGGKSSGKVGLLEKIAAQILSWYLGDVYLITVASDALVAQIP